jgi:protein associated with RNAse G/E
MVTVQFFKFPDRPHWRHEMRRLGEDEFGIWLGAPAGSIVQRGDEPAQQLDHPFVQLITPSTYWSLIYNGEDHKYPVYVDIATPATWVTDHRVEMIDIDLDVARRRSGTVEVLDEDEFLDHSERFDYPGWLIDRARTTAAELVMRLENRTEPFGVTPQGWLDQI